MTDIDRPKTASEARPRRGWKKWDVGRWITASIAGMSLLLVLYWQFIASDRYVSDAIIIIRKTDSVMPPALDLGMLIGGAQAATRTDQMLLREYLLSADMLKKLDEKLNVRAHYSDSSRDMVSRLWKQDLEHFHRHYQTRTSVEYDDFAGVLRLRIQAYDSGMAKAIGDLMVAEGERYMNRLGHEMADSQVKFLTSQVELAESRVQEATKRLLEFQNATGMISAQATAESIQMIISDLEARRAQTQAQLDSLPKQIGPDHPSVESLRRTREGIDRQIADQKSRLTDPSRQSLNATIGESQRVMSDVMFAKELLKAASTALEKGRVDAARLLDKVSVIQAPTRGEYPVEPRRIYNSVVAALMGLMLAGIAHLVRHIILDHID